MTAIPFEIPASLSHFDDGISLFTPGGPRYNYAIGGLPFLSAASEENPIIRETAPIQKEQIDDQFLPGEQSLLGWWLRSQQSFHGGAGQVFADPTQDSPNNFIRFRESRNVDVWQQGTVTLLNEAKPPSFDNAPGTRDAVEFVYGDGTHATFIVTGTELVIVTAEELIRATFAESSDLYSVTTNGTSIYVAAVDGVWRAAIPEVYNSLVSAFVWTRIYAFPVNDRSVFLAFVKSRLILTIGQSIYEIDPSPPEAGLHITGVAGDYASTPDSIALSITGDIDLRADVTSTWDAMGQQRTLVAKWLPSSSQRSYRMFLHDDNTIGIAFSGDGTNSTHFFVISQAPVSPNPITGRLAVRATFEIDNGSGQHRFRFYTASTIDGPWSEIGSAQNTASVVAGIFDSSADLEVNSLDGGTRHLWMDGVFHAVEVRNGVDGTVVSRVQFDEEPGGTREFLDNQNNAWTVNGSDDIFIASPFSLPEPVFRHQDGDWTWTGITETAAAILVVGNSNGVRGSVIKLVLDDTGEVPVLSQPSVALQLPFGEVPYSAVGYLGAFVGIGTNRGVRIGVSDNSGNVEYGPLLFESDSPVHAWAARGQFLWCTVSRGNQGDSGLYRIDLGLELAPLRFPYATDLVADGDVSDCMVVAHVGSTSQLVFGTTNELYIESGDKAPTAFLQTSRIRFNTVEPKIYKFVRLRGPELEAPLTISALDESDETILTVPQVIGVPLGESDTVLFGPTQPFEFISLRFDLTRSSVDHTVAPRFWAYQLKALPATPRQRLIQLPLLCFDWETDRHGQRIGADGSAKRRLTQLESLEREANTVFLQDFDVKENVECTIERVSFTQTAPSTVDGWGGILTVTLRTL